MRGSRSATVVIAKAQPLDHAGPEALHEHVGAADQPPQYRTSRCLLQIQRDRAFADIGRDRIRGVIAVPHAQAAAQSPVSVGSTLMTLAPYWASIIAQYGPATPWLTSITFRPA